MGCLTPETTHNNKIYLFCVLLDVSDSVTYSTDLLSLVIGNRDTKLLLTSLSTIIAFTLLSISDIIVIL